MNELQSSVDNWIQTYGVRYFSELTNLAILMEEVGELSRLMAVEYGEKSQKKEVTNSSMEGEIGDILFVLACIANQTGLSLENCFKNAISKNTSRDKDRHKQNPKL